MSDTLHIYILVCGPLPKCQISDILDIDIFVCGPLSKQRIVTRSVLLLLVCGPNMTGLYVSKIKIVYGATLLLFTADLHLCTVSEPG